MLPTRTRAIQNIQPAQHIYRIGLHLSVILVLQHKRQITQVKPNWSQYCPKFRWVCVYTKSDHSQHTHFSLQITMSATKSYAKTSKKRKFTKSPSRCSTALVRAVAKRIERQNPVEVKILNDYEWSAETLDDYKAPSLAAAFMQIPQGSQIYARTGNQVYLKGLQLKMKLIGSPSQQDAGVCVAVVEDLEPNARGADTAANLWAKVWDDTGNVDNNMVSMVNPAYRKRFRIRKQWYLDMTPTGAYYDPIAGNARWVARTVFLKHYVKIDKRVDYGSNITADPISGSNFYVFAWGATNANTTQVWLGSRLSFKDA